MELEAVNEEVPRSDFYSYVPKDGPLPLNCMKAIRTRRYHWPVRRTKPSEGAATPTRQAGGRSFPAAGGRLPGQGLQPLQSGNDLQP